MLRHTLTGYKDEHNEASDFQYAGGCAVSEWLQ